MMQIGQEDLKLTLGVKYKASIKRKEVKISKKKLVVRSVGGN